MLAFRETYSTMWLIEKRAFHQSGGVPAEPASTRRQGHVGFKPVLQIRGAVREGRRHNEIQIHQPLVGRRRRGRRTVRRPGASLRRHLWRVPQADHGRHGMGPRHGVVRVICRHVLLRLRVSRIRPPDGPPDHPSRRPSGHRRLRGSSGRRWALAARSLGFRDPHGTGRRGQHNSKPAAICQGDRRLVRPPPRPRPRHRDGRGRAWRLCRPASDPRGDRRVRLARRLRGPGNADRRHRLSGGRAVGSRAAPWRGRAAVRRWAPPPA